jgi:hypothetical protein
MYQELLATLVGRENKRVVVKDVGVSVSTIRTSLNRALVKLNQQFDLCGIPNIEGKVSIHSQVKDGESLLVIELVSASPSDRLPFTIIEETPDESKDST